MQVYRFTAKYKTATDFYINLETPTATNPDRFEATLAGGFAAGDVKVSKAGAAFANISALPTFVQAGNPTQKLSLTAAELEADVVVVNIIDQTVPPVWRDCMVIIETVVKVGQLDIDISQKGGNNPAISLLASGNEAGLKATGGAAGGHGLSGVGQGTGHGLAGTAGGGGGKITNVFDTLEGTEPTGAIVDNATVMQILQYVKRRFFNKRTQTASAQAMHKDDNTTVLQSCTSSDDGTTQSLGRYS